MKIVCTPVRHVTVALVVSVPPHFDGCLVHCRIDVPDFWSVYQCYMYGLPFHGGISQSIEAGRVVVILDITQCPFIGLAVMAPDANFDTEY